MANGQDAPSIPVNGQVSDMVGSSEQTQAQAIRLPRIFDMDLEKMNAELYKGKYLTPGDFLDDIRKIVHNATTRMHEDSDRLFKAHAMLTAAEVSIHDFEPQLKADCERMAVRERKRRAERREAKLKARAAAAVPTPDPHNDNRRVTRSAGATLDVTISDPLMIERRSKRQRSNEVTADSPASDSEDRTAKRSRLASDDGRDPLDIMSAQTSSPPQMTTNEYAPEVDVVPPSDGIEAEAMMVTVELALNSKATQELPAPSPSVMQTSSPHTPALPPSTLPATTADESSIDNPVTQEGDLPIPASQDAMDVVREPTPPPPDFIVDETKVNALRTALIEQTDGLSVEELEQLRASCLSCVWRHRADWDRAALLDELRGLIAEFVEEVHADAEATSPR